MATDERATYTVQCAGLTADYYRRLSAILAAPKVLDVTVDEIVTVKHPLLTDWLAGSPSKAALDAMAVQIRDLLLMVHNEARLCHRDVHVRNIVLTDDGEPLLIDPALGTDSATDLCYDLYGPVASGIDVPNDHVPHGKNGVWWGSQEKHDSLESTFGRWQDLV